MFCWLFSPCWGESTMGCLKCWNFFWSSDTILFFPVSNCTRFLLFHLFSFCFFQGKMAVMWPGNWWIGYHEQSIYRVRMWDFPFSFCRLQSCKRYLCLERHSSASFSPKDWQKRVLVKSFKCPENLWPRKKKGPPPPQKKKEEWSLDTHLRQETRD